MTLLLRRRLLALSVAVVAGSGVGYAVAADARPEDRVAPLTAAQTRVAAQAMIEAAVAAWYEVVHHGRAEHHDAWMESRGSVPISRHQCALAVATVDGERRVNPLRFWPTRWRWPEQNAQNAPVHTWLACFERDSPLDTRLAVADVSTRSASRGRSPSPGRLEFWLLRGPASAVDDLTAAIVHPAPIPPEYVDRSVSGPRGLGVGVAAFFAMLGLGLFIERSVRVRVRGPAQQTVRRISVAVPSPLASDLRGRIEALRHGDADPIRAASVRDALVDVLEAAPAAFIERTRSRPEEAEARFEALRDDLAARRATGATAGGYRDGRSGWVVATLLVRHECELPELLPTWSRDALAEMLRSSLPVAPRDLLAFDVLFSPSVVAGRLSDEELAEHFPELRPFDDADSGPSA